MVVRFLHRILPGKLRQRQLASARAAVEQYASRYPRPEPRSVDRRFVQFGQSWNAGLRDRAGSVHLSKLRGRLHTVVPGYRMFVVRGRTDASQRRGLRVHKGIVSWIVINSSVSSKCGLM